MPAGSHIPENLVVLAENNGCCSWVPADSMPFEEYTRVRFIKILIDLANMPCRLCKRWGLFFLGPGSLPHPDLFKCKTSGMSVYHRLQIFGGAGWKHAG